MGERDFGARLTRAIAVAAPLACASIPGLAGAVSATRGAIASGLGRDQGIFQYVAWAWSRGEVGYRDVRDVNGPLTPLVHLALLALGGGDEGRFRALDALVTGAVFAVTGALVADAASRGAEWTGPRRVALAVLGALAGWVVLSAQYLGFIFWDLAQRETFMDWFLLPALGLTLWALARRDRAASAALVAAGALSAATWLGKPTYGAFFVLQLAAAAVASGARRDRAKDAARLALGAALGFGLGCALASRWADLGSYARIALSDVPAMYRFIWPRTAADIAGLRPTTLALAIGTGLAAIALAVRGALPRPLAPLSLAPLAAFAGVVAQKKGFPYHFHPMHATLALAWLAATAHAVARLGASERAALRLAPTLLAGALGAWAALALRGSPHAGLGDLRRGSGDHLARFSTFDWFPDELAAAARHVRARTPEGSRVQHYGMDPYVLFLAERRSATPYIYAYDVNCDAALAGSADPAGLHPTEAEAAHIRDMCRMHALDLAARLERDPPAALVLVDGSPLLSDPRAEGDLAAHAPEAHRWIAQRYRVDARFGHVAVWLPANVTEAPGEIR